MQKIEKVTGNGHKGEVTMGIGEKKKNTRIMYPLLIFKCN